MSLQHYRAVIEVTSGLDPTTGSVVMTMACRATQMVNLELKHLGTVDRRDAMEGNPLT